MHIHAEATILYTSCSPETARDNRDALSRRLRRADPLCVVSLYDKNNGRDEAVLRIEVLAPTPERVATIRRIVEETASTTA